MSPATPKELNKQVTVLFNELLADTGFSKKRIEHLRRTTKDCEQEFTFYFTRNRGLPGTLYSLTATLSFTFLEINQMVRRFLDNEDAGRFGTGAMPLYVTVPNRSVLEYTYCSDEPLSQFAKMIAEDFRAYALPFYERYDTLEKLEHHFDQCLKGDRYGFHAVPAGRKPGSGMGCCIASVFCLLEKWDKLERFLKETDVLTDEYRERINEYILKR